VGVTTGSSSAEEREHLLALGDAFAASLVEGAAPVRFQIVTSPEELEATYRMRYRMIMAGGWADASEFPGGLERDRYDDRAVHLAGWDGQTLAAIGRLVFPQPDLLLPTEEDFGLRVEPLGHVVDVSRTAVAPSHRDPSHRVFLGMLARCWQEIRARGFTVGCGDANEQLLDLYRSIGFRIEVLAPPRDYWREMRQPFRCDVLASTREVLRRMG
jgi:predicted GNAT family N-acyltransferase